MSRRARPAGLGLAACTLACALAVPAPARAVMAGAPPDSPTARVDANLATSPWAGVVAVRVDGSATFSGVAIGRRHVLTAAHVVAGLAPDRVRIRLNAGAPLDLAVASIVVHPGFVGFNTPNLNDDLAIVILAADLPGSVPVYPLARSSPAQGTAFVAVGYGGSGQGDGSGRVGADPAVKRTGRNNADAFGLDDDGSGRPELFYFDFDGGGQPNRIGGTGFGNAVETSMSSGDSGSPSFVADTSPPQLFGVNTFLFAFPNGPADPGTFGTGGGGQVVASYATWIDATVAATSPAAAAEGDGEAPLPAWSAALIAAACAARLRRASKPAA